MFLYGTHKTIGELVLAKLCLWPSKVNSRNLDHESLNFVLSLWIFIDGQQNNEIM